jgi:hypothetical protein
LLKESVKYFAAVIVASYFSPVAGILFVESPWDTCSVVFPMYCFSPVAGILFVESLELNQAIAALEKGFSPVAGILFVESQQVFMILQRALLHRHR